MTLGFGVDTINFDAGNGGGTVRGISSAAQFTGVGTLTGTDASTGDGITVSGAGSATISAAGAAETISGAGSSGSNLFNAGSGNDTLIAGAGADDAGRRHRDHADAVGHWRGHVPV